MSGRTVAAVCIGMCIGFLAWEAFATTKEERKAERRANEARYEQCVNNCREKCYANK